jgi:hypothetical protein
MAQLITHPADARSQTRNMPRRQFTGGGSLASVLNGRRGMLYSGIVRPHQFATLAAPRPRANSKYVSGASQSSPPSIQHYLRALFLTASDEISCHPPITKTQRPESDPPGAGGSLPASVRKCFASGGAGLGGRASGRLCAVLFRHVERMGTGTPTRTISSAVIARVCLATRLGE